MKTIEWMRCPVCGNKTPNKARESLKATNQMVCVGTINNIHSRAMEIINTDLVYA